MPFPGTAPLVEYAVIAIPSFISGMVFGYVISNRGRDFDEEDVRVIIALIILIPYMISIFVEMAPPFDYETPLMLHGIVAGIVGYMFSRNGFNINIGKK